MLDGVVMDDEGRMIEVRGVRLMAPVELYDDVLDTMRRAFLEDTGRPCDPDGFLEKQAMRIANALVPWAAGGGIYVLERAIADRPVPR